MQPEQSRFPLCWSLRISRLRRVSHPYSGSHLGFSNMHVAAKSFCLYISACHAGTIIWSWSALHRSVTDLSGLVTSGCSRETSREECIIISIGLWPRCWHTTHPSTARTGICCSGQLSVGSAMRISGCSFALKALYAEILRVVGKLCSWQRMTRCLLLSHTSAGLPSLWDDTCHVPDLTHTTLIRCTAA